MKPTAVDPNTTTRTESYALWMDAPNPMVTFFKTLDVTPLARFSRKLGVYCQVNSEKLYTFCCHEKCGENGRKGR